MPDELYHLLAIKDDDTTISRIRVLTHPPAHGLDDLLPGELIAVVIAGALTYIPGLPDSNTMAASQQDVGSAVGHGDRVV